MRISYLLTGFGRSGGSFVLYRFMDELVLRGHDVFVITPKSALRWRLGQSQELMVRESPPGVLRGLVLKMPALRRILRGLHARVHPPAGVEMITRGLLAHWVASDVTVSTMFWTAFAGWALCDRTAAFYHMQGYEELFFADAGRRAIARGSYSLPLRLIANSSWLGEQIRRRFGRPSDLLTPGVDTEVFKPQGDIDAMYDGKGERLNVLTCYSSAPLKGWDDAVEAMRIVAKEVGRERLNWMIFGGTPPRVPGLNVVHCGRAYGSELASLYAQSHVVFMPSWFESFPLPPIEAMACGRAVVVTQHGVEDYARDGVNARIVPPRNVDLMARAIVGLLLNRGEAVRLAKAGVKTATEHTWSAATDRLERLLSEGAAAATIHQFSDVARLAQGRQ